MSGIYSIGIDLGRTSLRVAAYSEGHSFLEIIVLPTRLSAGRDQVVKDMCGPIKALMSRNYTIEGSWELRSEPPAPLNCRQASCANLPI